MQVICKSVLAFKNCQAVFRAHSLGALPVLAITGFRFCCKTNEKPYIFPESISAESVCRGSGDANSGAEALISRSIEFQ